jgi:hypothetical protein
MPYTVQYMEPAVCQEGLNSYFSDLRTASALFPDPCRITYETTGNQNINHMLLIAGVTPHKGRHTLERPTETFLRFLFPVHPSMLVLFEPSGMLR